MKTYVDFLRQGLPTFEAAVEVEKTEEIIDRHITGLQIPIGVFGFYFYDKTETGKPVNVSPMHYVGGQVSVIDGQRVLEFKGDIVTSTFGLKPDDVLIAI
jgi:hypothetical protein